MTYAAILAIALLCIVGVARRVMGSAPDADDQGHAVGYEAGDVLVHQPNGSDR